MNREEKINSTIKSISDVTIINPFVTLKNDVIKGLISIFVEEIGESIEFDVTIDNSYPFKYHNSESIKFSNKKLLKYKHIMQDGNICIHSPHSVFLEEKLKYDIEAVKLWIRRYYINDTIESHYEHLIVSPEKIEDRYYSFFFNIPENPFNKNEYGYMEYSEISILPYHQELISNNIIQSLRSKTTNKVIDVEWNPLLKGHYPIKFGLFVFIKDFPSNNQRWVFEKWGEFETLLPQQFLDFLYNFAEYNKKKDKNFIFPLLMGYDIPNKETHWEVAMLELRTLPTKGEKINKLWYTKLIEDAKVNWAITKNCSPKYFFGRGTLCEALVQSKILVIGIGAVGSILAKTLVRSGCTELDVIDFDLKEPENVCRSEYPFITGITNKVDDLITNLLTISPFLKTKNSYRFSELFELFLKTNLINYELKGEIEKYLCCYDIIIDCTADNDLLYIFSQLDISSEIFNISISNYAKQLVCAVENNRYDFVLKQFQRLSSNLKEEDLYNPTGCWSPTFRASYNDINVLVQFAIKHINIRKKNGQELRNFILDTKEDDFGIILKEF